MSVKVKAYEANSGYEDKYVSRSKMAFSFLSDDDKMVGPFVDCKDYMNNRLHGSITAIDGGNEYKFQPSKMDPVSMEKTRILVCRQVSPIDHNPLEAKAFEDEIKLAIDLLNRIEKDLHLIKSTYSTVTGIKKEYGQVLLVEGSRRWMLASPMLSLYLLLLRNAYLHKEGQSYIKTIESSPEIASSTISIVSGAGIVDAVKFIVKHKYANVFGKSIEKNYPPEITADQMHSAGIRAFSLCLQTHLWPHWVFPNKAVAVKPVKKLKETVA